MKPITTSVYTFTDLIDGHFLYVDKTAEIYKLIGAFKGQYFLSRPRRFGKSLLISTLEAIFQGRRGYFKGLALDSLPYDWKTYPVLHLDMGSIQPRDPGHFYEIIGYRLNSISEHEGIELKSNDIPSRFQELIERLSSKSPTGKVVLLIDEYDKPLLGHLGRPDVTAVKDALKAFYSVIKTTEPLQRFALLTGVSKFSKVSVFSDLNNLTDLTMDARTATLLGYTREEVARNFADRLPLLAKAIGKTEAETLGQLERWYDGYRFQWGAETVFNPVSVGRCFDTLEFDNYWFETGTPTFLVGLLKNNPVDIDNITATKDDFGVYEPESPAVIPLLVQTGYLTILSSYMDGEIRTFRLGFPNVEVSRSFSQWLAEAYTGLDASKGMTSFLARMAASLRSGDVGAMLGTLSLFFANIPNTITIRQEKYYQTIFFAVFTLIGARVEAEVSTNVGRIDAVVKAKDVIFVFEFKLDGSAKAAMAQIRAKKYYEKYLGDGRKIVLVGVAFSAKTRNLGRHIIEEA